MTGTSNNTAPMVHGDRRRFMRLAGGTAAMAAGLQLLSACDDDVQGSEAVPVANAPTPAATVAAYTPTDADRLNFVLQLHYLLGSYLQAAVNGTTLPAALTGGSGTAGTVTGGRRVALSDPLLLSQLQEIVTDTVAQLGYLRRILSGGATAMPAIDITGGQGGPFQAITVAFRGPNAAPTPASTGVPVFFDPYASPVDFLLGSIALSGVLVSAIADIVRSIGAAFVPGIVALASAAGARDAVLRAALFKLASAEMELAEGERGKPTIFDRSGFMSDARDSYDSDRNQDEGIGDNKYANILSADEDRNALRRTPEQALAVVYASASPKTSGAFFPNGVNGPVRTSGSNVLS